MTGEAGDSAAFRLNILLEEAGLEALPGEQASRYEQYLSLLLRWNARINLTAIRDEDGILSRHFVESIACARALPAGTATLLDFGSGAGFPGIPIALSRPEIAVTLAESNGRKAAFLNEAVRVLGLPAKVDSVRAETLASQFDSVTLRAVDRMTQAVEAAARRVRPGRWLVLMTTERELKRLKPAAGPEFSWTGIVQLPGGRNRIVALGKREISLPA